MSIKFNLQFFAEDEVTAEPTTQEGIEPTGVVADNTATDNGNPEPIEGEQSLKDMLKANPKLKKQYDDMFAKSFNKRMAKHNKEVEALQTVNNQMSEVMQIASYRYGLDVNSPTFNQDLLNALQNDASFLETQAMEAGMDTESFLKVKKAEELLARQNRERQSQEQQEEMNAVLTDIMSRCENVKSKYPDFDFNAEMENEQFFRLVAPLGRGGSGIDPLVAYEVMHPEIKNAMVNQQINTAVANTTKTMNNNLNRPQENGVSNNSASKHQVDVSKLKLEDIEKIKERVKRGEKITFDSP